MTQDVTLKVKYTWSGLGMSMENHANWIRELLVESGSFMVSELESLECEPISTAEYEEVAAT